MDATKCAKVKKKESKIYETGFNIDMDSVKDSVKDRCNLDKKILDEEIDLNLLKASIGGEKFKNISFLIVNI